MLWGSIITELIVIIMQCITCIFIVPPAPRANNYNIVLGHILEHTQYSGICLFIKWVGE